MNWTFIHWMNNMIVCSQFYGHRHYDLWRWRYGEEGHNLYHDITLDKSQKGYWVALGIVWFFQKWCHGTGVTSVVLKSHLPLLGIAVSNDSFLKCSFFNLNILQKVMLFLADSLCLLNGELPIMQVELLLNFTSKCKIKKFLIKKSTQIIHAWIFKTHISTGF